MSLLDRTDELDDAVGVPFSYIVVLFEDYAGCTPEGPEAAIYAESLGDPPYPVVADPSEEMVPATPYPGRPLPGKCLLSPQMEILGCESGHGDDTWAYPLIEAHEGR